MSYQHAVEHAIYFEDIEIQFARRESTLRGGTTSSSFVEPDGCFTSTVTRLQLWWHARGREFTYKLAFYCSMILSSLIIVGEFSIMF